MKTTTFMGISLILGLAACSEQSRENMRDDADRAGEDVERGFQDTGDRLYEEHEEEERENPPGY
jgi:hypothetical protein